MKKILSVLTVLLCLALQCHAYTEENTISAVLNGGKVIRMIDGSMYKIWDYDAVTSMIWLPMTDVVITDDRIINIDDHESVDYQYRIR